MAKRIIRMLLTLSISLSPLSPLCTEALPAQAITIDHTCTDISRIPAYWLEEAKKLTLHFAHTSHGSQIISGLLNLESQEARYALSVRTDNAAGLPPEEVPAALRIYDGNPPETYIEPEDYWNSEEGKNRTRAVAGAGIYDFSMWAWCGQVSSATETYIETYLQTLNQFESEHPDMRFIYMTGHLDGTGPDGNLHLRNQQIRDYCLANDKVLFDFADMERYDPDGNDYLALGANDNCGYSGGNWATEWCAAHTGSELCGTCSCAHSQALNCNVKARAFWWMMARLAGWEPAASNPLGSAPGLVNVAVRADEELDLALNVGNARNWGPDEIAQEWLILSATIGGENLDVYFLTTAGDLVPLPSAANPDAVTYAFDHGSETMRLPNFSPGSLGLSSGDCFWYGYAFTRTPIADFSNAGEMAGLVFENTVILRVE